MGLVCPIHEICYNGDVPHPLGSQGMNYVVDLTIAHSKNLKGYITPNITCIHPFLNSTFYTFSILCFHPWCLDGRVGGRREKVCPGCISETVMCRKLILGRDIG